MTDKIKEETCDHKPDWHTLTISWDSCKYIDVSCKKCGLSGCIGRAEVLAEDINWE